MVPVIVVVIYAPYIPACILTLKDLVTTIAAKLQQSLSEGNELYGRKSNRVYPCKIVKVLESKADKTLYEVVWLGKDKKITGNAVISGDDLVRKLPFTRAVLKSFIRESTYRSVPWVLHENLARKHGISTNPPEVLRSKIFLQDGHIVCNRKRRKTEDDKQSTDDGNNDDLREHKQKRLRGEKSEALNTLNADKEDDKLKGKPIKYPIEDLLVEAAADDPIFTERPSPSRDFNVPMDCVGDLLMVWDFCTSFSRLLHLCPFSLEDFENALCHKGSNSILIVESLSALLRLLIKDNGDYFLAIQKKKRKSKITVITWTEYLCDFLEMVGFVELSTCITTIKRGHYGLLDICAKLGIFRELVNQALAADIVREKLDKYIEERQALAATRREVALEEGRKKREEKERLKVESDGNGMVKGHGAEVVGTSSSEPVNHNHSRQNGHVAEKQNEKSLSSGQKHPSRNSGNNHVSVTLKNIKQQKVDVKVVLENDSSENGVRKQLKDENNEAIEKRSKAQRKDYLEREMEKRFIRTSPFGKDKYHNRYWFFRRDERIFVESSDSTEWGYYSAKDELDALMGSLNTKGERERALKKQLGKYYTNICSELQKRSKEAAYRSAMEDSLLRRSNRVRAPPRENPALAFLKYVNKWKED
ncbi:unnamed protein product [Ilex paraguariensis]|uniref:DDT domain-containing protein n=1 Tax=Ilex paraguariensis TaxID=185542 RepID=A0ABC8V2W1_9AQUA